MIDDISELKVANDYRPERIRSSSVYQETGNLSGGNQQKVVLSKWLLPIPQVLILDEPTRGIDVGAKYEIYTIINKLAEEGKGVLVISSEMPELLGICDRIYVINEGRIVGELAALRRPGEDHAGDHPRRGNAQQECGGRNAGRAQPSTDQTVSLPGTRFIGTICASMAWCWP